MTYGMKESKQEPKLRSKQQISDEYTQHAALLGDRVYRQGMLQVEVNHLQKKMNELNNEKSEETSKLEAVPSPSDAVLPDSA